MTSLFAAELLKLRTVRATWGMLLVSFLLSGLFTASTIGSETEVGRLDPDFQFRLVLDGAFPAVVLALLLGMIHFTNEFRHGTIARTLLATPRRGRLVGIKVLAGAATGIGLFVVTSLVTASVAVIWLGIIDVPFEIGEAAEAGGRALTGAVLAGMMGAALGGAIHSQVGALVGTLVWIFIAEPLVWVLLGLADLDGAAEYLPASSLLGVADSSGDALSFGPSAAVALAWIALATALALLRTGRRDIT